MDEELIIGIDLGTTNSLAGVVESGFPIVLADRAGRRMCPSVVHFSTDGSILTGTEAQRVRALHPDRTVASVKRLMGQSPATVPPGHADGLSYETGTGEDGQLAIVIDDGLRPTPEEISAHILRRLRETAETALDQVVSRAVITVPAYFNNAQREATKRAGEAAGFRVERILNEPTAAALAFGLDRIEKARTVAVYDLGGGTFDLSVLQMREGFFEVIATAGDTRLGGDDIDLAFARHLAREMALPEAIVDAHFDAVLTVAREGKERLSDTETWTARLPFLGGASYETTTSREDLESLARPIVEQTRGICRRAFAEAESKGAGTIDHLVLVGGSTRMPLVRRSLEEWFEMEPDTSQHPDEAVALGAAIQAGILCGRVRQVVLLDVTPLSLGIETIGGLMNVIIPRNSSIPAKAGEMFTNAVTNQDAMAIRVLQGEREMAKDNWELGQIAVPFPAGPKGSARVGVQFAIDENGILEVLARDTATGQDHILEIRDAAVDVDDVAVEEMIGASVEHAFDDMNERIWTEAALKSDELLEAVALALEQAGDALPPNEREAIERAADTVRTIRESDSRDATPLKDANAVLDEATQGLAALLVDQAFSRQWE